MKPLHAGIIACSLFMTSAVARADWSWRQPGQPKDFGAGVVLGSPTGFTMKYWMDQISAFDGSLAYKFGHEDRFAITADYLWHIPLPVAASFPGKLPFYVGGGLRVLTGNDSEAGIRIPLGLSLLLGNAPIEFFAEVVPVVRFAPDTDADLDGGVGLRYYFKPAY
jgi:hypothetical protein